MVHAKHFKEAIILNLNLVYKYGGVYISELMIYGKYWQLA